MSIKLDYIVFGVADYDSDIRILKFKMADRIWRLYFAEFHVLLNRNYKNKKKIRVAKG